METAIISNLIANLPIEVTMQELAKVVVIPNEKKFCAYCF